MEITLMEALKASHEACKRDGCVGPSVWGILSSGDFYTKTLPKFKWEGVTAASFSSCVY